MRHSCFLLLCLLALLAPLTTSHALDRQLLTIGSGPLTSDHYVMAGAVCAMINDQRLAHGIRCVVVPTDGSVYNLSAIHAGEIDWGIAQSNWSLHAYAGSERFTTVGANTRLRRMMTVGYLPLMIAVRDNSSIEKLDHLLGRRIHIPSGNAAGQSLMNEVMAAKGWTNRLLTIVNDLDDQAISDALCDEAVDAIAIALTNPNGILQSISQTCAIRIIDLNDQALVKQLSQKPDIEQIQLDDNLYANVSSDQTNTFAYRLDLVGLSDTHTKAARELIKMLTEYPERFQQLHPILQHFDPNRALRGGQTGDTPILFKRNESAAPQPQKRQ